LVELKIGRWVVSTCRLVKFPCVLVRFPGFHLSAKMMQNVNSVLLFQRLLRAISRFVCSGRDTCQWKHRIYIDAAIPLHVDMGSNVASQSNQSFSRPLMNYNWFWRLSQFERIKDQTVALVPLWELHSLIKIPGAIATRRLSLALCAQCASCWAMRAQRIASNTTMRKVWSSSSHASMPTLHSFMASLSIFRQRWNGIRMTSLDTWHHG